MKDHEATADKMQDLMTQGLISRRTLLRAAGITAVAGAATAALGGRSLAGIKPQVTDADVLNFALNLEYLEAEFYTVATTGKYLKDIGIGIDGTGTPGNTTGGHRVNFLGDDVLTGVSQQIAYDEQQHVLLLRSALGSAKVAKPAINLNALGIGYRSPFEFMTLARAFEDVGVSAYGGAAPLLSSAAVATAARILATETYHASNIRLYVALNGVTVGKVDAIDLPPPPAGSNYFAVDSKGLSIVRTPRQVLDIVYGSAGASKGGFYPNGMNGTITA